MQRKLVAVVEISLRSFPGSAHTWLQKRNADLFTLHLILETGPWTDLSLREVKLTEEMLTK